MNYALLDIAAFILLSLIAMLVLETRDWPQDDLPSDEG